MNRYGSGGPSKATATTVCQKCLKRGHYTYECTAAQQERPYTSRPSRSQQLNNPSLAPKLSATLPPPEILPAPKAESKKSVSTTESRCAASRDRQRLRRKVINSPDRKHRRSVSTHSSDSISTISTDRSRYRSRSPPPRQRVNQSNKVRSRERRRSSLSSRRDERRREEDLGMEVREHRASNPDYRARPDPPPRRNRSPMHEDQHSSRRRPRSRSPYRDQSASKAQTQAAKTALPRRRSLSPYSQRVAMTKAMN